MEEKKKDTFELEDMNKLLYQKLIKNGTLYTDVFFIVAHLFYFIFFIIYQYYIIAFVNLGLAGVFASYYVFIKKEQYAVFVICSYLTSISHITMATMMCGFDAGFQLTLIALMVALFFVGYFSKSATNKIKPIGASLIMLALSIFLFIWLRFMPPLYELSLTANSMLFVIHIIFVFVVAIIFLSYFITYVIGLEKRITKDSQTDKLTNLGNRKALMEYLKNIDLKKNSYTLAMIDIDDFKKVNDRYGHLCGDLVLRKTSEIANSVSKDAKVFRYGGEEFIIIDKINDTYEANCEMLDKVRQTIADYEFNYDIIRIRITITIGVEISNPNISVEEWISKADDKLYYGKKNGKNQVVK